MAKLFTISPFILAESIPSRSSTASIISEHFTLFNIYSLNPYIVREYMNFIDANFDFAFSILKYKIISYDFPDRYIDDESGMIEYINQKYELSNDFVLDRCFNANIYHVRDYVNNRNLEIYLNDYALYDISFLNKGIYDVDENIVDNLDFMVNYLNDKNISDLIKSVILVYYEYEDAINEYSLKYTHFHTSYLVSEPLLILSQLKSFVRYTREERENE